MKTICLFCGALWKDGQWTESHWHLCFGQRYGASDKRDVPDEWQRGVDPLPPMFGKEVTAELDKFQLFSAAQNR